MPPRPRRSPARPTPTPADDRGRPGPSRARRGRRRRSARATTTSSEMPEDDLGEPGAGARPAVEQPRAQADRAEAERGDDDEHLDRPGEVLAEAHYWFSSRWSSSASRAPRAHRAAATRSGPRPRRGARPPGPPWPRGSASRPGRRSLGSSAAVDPPDARELARPDVALRARVVADPEELGRDARLAPDARRDDDVVVVALVDRPRRSRAHSSIWRKVPRRSSLPRYWTWLERSSP